MLKSTYWSRSQSVPVSHAPRWPHSHSSCHWRQMSARAPNRQQTWQQWPVEWSHRWWWPIELGVSKIRKIFKFSTTLKPWCMQLKGEIKSDWKKWEPVPSKCVSEQRWVSTIPLLLIPNSHISIGSHTKLRSKGNHPTSLVCISEV